MSASQILKAGFKATAHETMENIKLALFFAVPHVLSLPYLFDPDYRETLCNLFKCEALLCIPILAGEFMLSANKAIVQYRWQKTVSNKFG